MSARKAVFGLCALCAVLISALAAQSAAAISQVWDTCWKEGTQSGPGRFSDAHCKTSAVGPYYHSAWSGMTIGEDENELTEGTRQPGFLKATIGGLETIIEAKKISAGAMFENLESGGEKYATVTAEAVVFEEVSVTNRACEFTGVNPGGSETSGKVESQPMKGSTKGQASGVLRFEPQTGTKIAEFKLSGASCPAALKGSYPVFGSILSNAAEGATVPIAHPTVTAEAAPKLRLKSTEGPLAGLEGKITDRANDTESLPVDWHALSLTPS